jgi:hypothetical protein
VITGGAGDDTLDGWLGQDYLTGGTGLDVFRIADAQSVTTGGLSDVISDWTTEDALQFTTGALTPIGAGTLANYVEITGVASFAEALAIANAQIGGTLVNYVAVQVGADVVVFADSNNDNGTADSAVVLAGKTLNDISVANII